MSLNYDFNAVAAREPDFVKEHRYVLHNIVPFAMMATGIGWELTAKNLEEFRFRLSVLTELDAQPFELTPLTEDVMLGHKARLLVGFKTNVAPETRNHFLRRTANILVDRAVRRLAELNEREEAKS